MALLPPRVENGNILTSEVETELSDTDDEPSMTSEEESEDERVPNHLVSMRTLTYQATHKELLAPVTLDPTHQRFGGAKKACFTHCKD